MSNALLGKTIRSIKLASDKGAVLFSTNTGDLIAECDAECCSCTWIEHIELPALGFPAKVLTIEDLDLPGSEDEHPEHDCLQVYGLKITTDKGEIIIDYRNSSNGYYGGSLTWEGECYYTGDYGESCSEKYWSEVAQDV